MFEEDEVALREELVINEDIPELELQRFDDCEGIYLTLTALDINGTPVPMVFDLETLDSMITELRYMKQEAKRQGG